MIDTSDFAHPKPTRKEKQKTPLRKIGKVGRERLDVVAELTKQAASEGWLNHCEIGPVLVEHNLAEAECFGPLTFAHSQKAHKRGSNPELARQVTRACEGHHFYTLDLLPSMLTEKLVLEAIARRQI